MKIFIDTAKLAEIKESISWGIVDGVTTNPSLVRKALDEERTRVKVSIEDYISEICRVAGEGRPVSLEVLSNKAEKMIDEAQILYKKFNPIARNVVIKIPINTSTEQEANDYEGLKAIKQLSEKGIPVNVTLIMTPEQALLGAKAGARYVSPFAGRIDDYLRECANKRYGKDFQKSDYYPRLGEKGMHYKGIVSGVDCVEKTLQTFRKYNIKTEVIAASMRNAQQVREVAELGCDIATVPFGVLQEMLKHPKTEEGIKNFYKDAIEANYEEIF
ncbi:MAG: transaldolase family protein [Candidatus Thermoplasmatota archaeon]|nr:transaldolase family protein [Candidatus Thermoplasmatota archaeon]